MKRAVVVVACSSIVVACAANKAAPKAQEPAAPSSERSDVAGGQPYAQPPGSPQQPGQAGAYAPPPPPPAPQATTGDAAKKEPSSTPSTTSRGVAIQQASSDIESAQRELDVAGGDCRNACRALGSMDRAAGHLCQLTREDRSQDRCDDAKRRVYGARDRVRNTCGRCPDDQPATDRNAPIPSMR